MKNIIIISCIATYFLTAIKGNAQVIERKLAPANVVIDGSLSEWGDQLYLTDKKGTISYFISNDRNNLYLILKTKDTVYQANILGSGITFTVSANNSKIDQKVTFPLRGKEDPTEYMNLDRDQVEIKTILTRYKRIGVKNFKNIQAEELSTTNPYGIKVSLGYTEDGTLVYEEAIPLTLLLLGEGSEKYSYDIKVNGLVRKVYFLVHAEMVPSGKRDKKEQIDDYIQTHFRNNFKMGGPMPENDYEDNVTADTDIKGEFTIN